MKGVALLTVPRSGSEWLGSLANAAGTMGRFGEWLDLYHHTVKPKSYHELERSVFKLGTSANGCFAIKLFPIHLRETYHRFGTDFLLEILTKHEIGLVLLERRDRLRQAISYHRGSVSKKWTSRLQGTGTEAVYNFAEILRSYAYLEHGYSFWSQYLTMLGLQPRHVVYEQLLENPAPFVEIVAAYMDVSPPLQYSPSTLSIQRDGLTEEWVARFRSEAKAEGIISLLLDDERPAARTLSNLRRFLRRRPLKRA